MCAVQGGAFLDTSFVEAGGLAAACDSVRGRKGEGEGKEERAWSGKGGMRGVVTAARGCKNRDERGLWGRKGKECLVARHWQLGVAR